MPVTLGARPPIPDDPFALLADCHARIRRFTSLAQRLVAAPLTTPPAEISAAATDAIRYFTVALPLHEQDEEASLAPRLGEMDLPESARTALAALGPEHRAIEEVVATLLPKWAEIARDPLAKDRDLETPSHRLAALFDAHLLREERDLFPAARRAMSATDLSALLQEIRARRS